MRICYLSNANNYHTIKWCRWFAERGNQILVLSLDKCTNSEMMSIKGVTVHWLKSPADRNSGEARKLGYLLTVRQAKKEIRDFSPDIIHAHYASSYGLVAAFACRRGYYLSVWGSDIYDFPRKSLAHRLAIMFSLKRAEWILSTSRAMAVESSRYTDKTIEITPFGVDMSLFSPEKRLRSAGDGRFVIGTVKALEAKYGIDVLLKGVAKVFELRPDIHLEVRIAGTGSQRQSLESLAANLGLSDCVTWLGFISQQQAAIEWANMDVAVMMSESESESFGVSSVESQACGTPVIYSDIPGLMETANDCGTGICVKRGDINSLADAIIQLHDDDAMRLRKGEEGREFVKEAFELNGCFERILASYHRNAAFQNGLAS